MELSSEMDKKRHKPHTSKDVEFEDGGGKKRLKEIKSSINKRVVDHELIDEDSPYHDELEYYVKKFK